MSKLIERLKEDLKATRKEKDSYKSGFLATLYADCMRVGKDNGDRETTDAEAVSVIKKYLRGLEETISYCKERNMQTSNQEQEKIWLESYLPTQLSYEELATIISNYSIDNKTKSIGDIIKYLKSSYEGQYDAKSASEIIKQL